MKFFGENAQRNAASEFTAHYHSERDYQGLDHRLIDLGTEVGMNSGEIVCRERLGCLLKYYDRRAA